METKHYWFIYAKLFENFTPLSIVSGFKKEELFVLKKWRVLLKHLEAF